MYLDSYNELHCYCILALPSLRRYDPGRSSNIDEPFSLIKNDHSAIVFLIVIGQMVLIHGDSAQTD